MAIKKQFVEEGRELPLRAETVDQGELVGVPVRIHKERLNAMRRYFENRGLNVSSGVRLVLYEYLDKNHIR